MVIKNFFPGIWDADRIFQPRLNRCSSAGSFASIARLTLNVSPSSCLVGLLSVTGHSQPSSIVRSVD